MHNIIFLTEVSYGVIESIYILNESHQCSKGKNSLKQLTSSIPDDQGNGKGANNLYRRMEQSMVKDSSQAGFKIVMIQLFELTKISLFPVEYLNNGHADDTLLQKGINTSYSCSNISIRFSHLLAKKQSGID